MKMRSIFRISLLLLPILFQLATAAPPVTKPGCQNRCGNISIPYPFGTAQDCYANEMFKIVCRETTNESAPRAFISMINMEVLNITDGAAIVNGPIMSSNCSDRQSNLPALNLTGSPFFFSFGNVFTAVGCNVRALLTGIGRQVVGCDSTCSADSNQKTLLYGQEINSLCADGNCCVARAPYRMQVFQPSLDTKNGSEDSSGCKLAFLTDETNFSFLNITNPQALQGWRSVPLVLAWMMDYSIWRYDKSTMDCKYFLYESSVSNVSGYECSCSNGYEGNPYLGCTGNFAKKMTNHISHNSILFVFLIISPHIKISFSFSLS
jgi:hypothetical protein